MQHKKAGRATFQWTAIAAAAVAMSGTLGSPAFAAPGALATSAKAFVAPAVQDLGPASPATVKTFTIGLALRNAGALDPLLRSLSNPASPDFRHFLTPAQFAARFGQTDAAIASAVAHLQAQGIADVQVAATSS